MGLFELIPNATQAAASAMVASVWQGILLAVLIEICLKLAPKTSASVRFLVWMGVFLAVSFSPVLALYSVLHAASTSQAVSHIGSGEVMRGIHLDSRWTLAVVALWVAFFLARGIRLVHCTFKLRELWKRSTPVEECSAIAPLLHPAGSLRSAPLCLSSEIDQPCVIGFFAPRILVPGWLLQKSTPAELEQIVLHEVAHLRRFDDWTNLLQKVALLCFPLNPALLWLDRCLSSERERACDESVIRATRAPRDYAVCLTNLAADRAAARTRAAALSLGAWEKRSELAARIHEILRPVERRNPLAAGATLAALLLATLGGAIRLGQSAPLVFFAAPEISPASTLEARQLALPRVVYLEPAARKPVRRKLAPENLPASGSVSGGAIRVLVNAVAPVRYRSEKATQQSASLLRRPVSPEQPTVVLVTRWEDSAGRGTSVTLIQDGVALGSVVQFQSSWYVLQL